MPATKSPPLLATLDAWLTPSQVAVLIGRTPLRVRQLCDAGKLHVVRTPLGRLIDPLSVDALLRQRETQAVVATATEGV